VLGREVLEAGVDVVGLDKARGTSLPAAAEVDSHVGLGVEVVDVAGSAAVFGDDSQHGVGLTGDATTVRRERPVRRPVVSSTA
jgi:hypothetical protein